MELSRAQKVRLGAFVITGVVLLGGSGLVLAGLRVWEVRDVYTVRYAASVSGLEASSQVRYQGLRVGRVESMRIDPEDPKLIEVTLSVQAGTVLYEGTEATMALSGITGLKTINLTPGEPRKGVIPPGSELPAGSSFMEKLEDDAEIIAAKVARVTDQLAEWTSEANRQRVERILDNAAALTETVEGVVRRGERPVLRAMGQLTDTAASFERLSHASSAVLEDNREEMQRTLTVVRQNLQQTRRLLAEVDEQDVRRFVTAVRAAAESAQRRFSDEELGQLIGQLTQTLGDVTGLLDDVDLAVRASREDFVLALKRVREASEDIREFSRLIAQDPSVLVRGAEITE